MDAKLLLRPTEVAEAIGVGRSKVYELLAKGELPSIRIGGSLHVPVNKLRDWIDKKAGERAEPNVEDNGRHGAVRRR